MLSLQQVHAKGHVRLPLQSKKDKDMYEPLKMLIANGVIFIIGSSKCYFSKGGTSMQWTVDDSDVYGGDNNYTLRINAENEMTSRNINIIAQGSKLTLARSPQASSNHRG